MNEEKERIEEQTNSFIQGKKIVMLIPVPIKYSSKVGQDGKVSKMVD